MDDNLNTGILPEGEDKFIEISVPTAQWKIDTLLISLQEAGINCYSHSNPKYHGTSTMAFPGYDNQSIYVQASQIEEAKKLIEDFPLEDVEVTIYMEDEPPRKKPTLYVQPMDSDTKMLLILFGAILLLIFVFLAGYAMRGAIGMR